MEDITPGTLSDLERKYSYTRQYDKEVHAELSDCIKHHQDILIFCEKLEGFFSPIILVKILFGTLGLCLVGYMLTTVSVSSYPNS